jgi:hypothetical protein
MHDRTILIQTYCLLLVDILYCLFKCLVNIPYINSLHLYRMLILYQSWNFQA